jgi:two-component sensor histidine kinase
LFSTFIHGQEHFEAFKSLENQVKYSNPDRLSEFANTIDTTTTYGQVISSWARGKAFYWKSDYPNAFIQLKEAAELAEDIKDKMLLGEIYLDLSSSLAIVDNQGKALSYMLDANGIFEKVGSNEQQSRAAISLGELYRKIGDHVKAMDVLRSTLPKTKSLSYQKARCLNRMAAVFSETGKSDSSLLLSRRSLEISNELGDPDLIATSENEIGYMLRLQDRFQESLPHFFKADSLWRSAGMNRYAANPIHHAAVVYRSIGKVEKGLKITHKAYALTKGKGWYQIEMNQLDDLKAMHDLLNNEDSVLFYDRARLEAAISFRTKQFEVNTKMVEILYTQKENEQTIREQSIQIRNEALEKEVINRERITLLIIVSLIVIILLIIFIYAFNQRKLQKKLAIENAEKEKKNEQLLVALGANEALVQEISHRVKNNLAVLSGLLTMQANRSDNATVKKELTDSILRIESIATIHKKLYDKRSDAKVNLKEALSELSENVVSAMGKDPSEVLEMSLDEVELDIAEAVTLCLIVNEAITNSCKYANVGSDNKLHVNLVKENDQLTCRIIDHGPGFDDSEVPKESTSLGVYLIRLLSKQLGAKLNWTKTDETFILSIELKSDG